MFVIVNAESSEVPLFATIEPFATLTPVFVVIVSLPFSFVNALPSVILELTS